MSFCQNPKIIIKTDNRCNICRTKYKGIKYEKGMINVCETKLISNILYKIMYRETLFKLTNGTIIDIQENIQICKKLRQLNKMILKDNLSSNNKPFLGQIELTSSFIA